MTNAAGCCPGQVAPSTDDGAPFLSLDLDASACSGRIYQLIPLDRPPAGVPRLDAEPGEDVHQGRNGGSRDRPDQPPHSRSSSPRFEARHLRHRHPSVESLRQSRIDF